MNRQKGFTAIEILIVIIILALIGAILMTSLSSFTRSQALDKKTGAIISMLREARSLSLSSKNSSVHGVYFDNSRAFLFKGDTYISGDSNNVPLILGPHVKISSTSINGGGSEIIFNKLKGDTDQHGLVELSLITDSLATKTISIYETGLVE